MGFSPGSTPLPLTALLSKLTFYSLLLNKAVAFNMFG